MKCLESSINTPYPTNTNKNRGAVFLLININVTQFCGRKRALI